jgi:hypothetical protein
MPYTPVWNVPVPQKISRATNLTTAKDNEIAALRSRAEKAEAECDRLRVALESTTDDFNNAAAQCERMREALEPFSKFNTTSIILKSENGLIYEVVLGVKCIHEQPSFAHFAAARAALQDPK